jgi:hypothetical protein
LAKQQQTHTLRGCAVILGDCACPAKDVERLLIEAMEVRFALDLFKGEVNGPRTCLTPFCRISQKASLLS